MKRIFNNLIILTLFLSCSSPTLILGGRVQESGDSQIIIENDIASDEYGPQSGSAAPESQTSREPVIAHLFPPGLYHSASYIGVLKRYEKRKVPVNMLVGSEFGALIATLYSKYKKASIVEWKFFSLVQKLGKHKLYSKRWKRILESFIKKEFNKIKIESLKIPLILPLYSKKLEKVIYIKKGHALTILNAHFELDRASKLSVIPPQSLVLYSQEAVSNLGADLVASYVPFGDVIEFTSDDGLIWGIYSNIKNRVSVELDKFDINFLLKYQNNKIDDSSSLSSFTTVSQRQAENFAIEIIQEITIWKENNN